MLQLHDKAHHEGFSDDEPEGHTEVELEAVAGGWCTSRRMHSDIQLPCIFGCTDSLDEITHYFVCPILWSLGRETLSFQEASVSVCESFVHPNTDKLKLLAFCHTLYHCIANDNQSILQDGTLQPPQCVQRRAVEFTRQIRHMILG